MVWYAACTIELYENSDLQRHIELVFICDRAPGIHQSILVNITMYGIFRSTT